MTGGSVVAERPDTLGESDSAAAYRPHLDGLRAVAVYLVVLFHAGSDRFTGGFIGVDVFFVLSGYLVTQLLLRDISRNGSIRFGRFYSRRFRRLLPAAFIALIVTAAVYTAIATSGEVSDAVGSFKAAFLYSTNWYFIHQAAGYFGADVSANPVLHFWSLAVEEQFYLLWPLALGGVYAVTRRLENARQMRTIRIVVALSAVASALFALSLRSSNPNRAYYGTDARAYELLAGAFVALTPALFVAARRFRRWSRATTLLSMAALAVVATSVVDYNAIVRGVIITIITCVLIVSVEAAEGGLVKRALSTPSMVYLGKISYGTYLWHWIVILITLRVFNPSSLSTAAIAILAATALASLSFEMVERPIRISSLLDGHRRAVIASGLAISVAAALVVIPRIVDPEHASTATSTNTNVAAYLTPVSKDLDWKDPLVKFTKCVNEPVSACTVVKGKGRKILLLGDSHAFMLIPIFSRIARRTGMQLSVDGEGGCPWQNNVYTEVIFAKCKALKADVYRRVIPQIKPDIIVLMNIGYGHPGPYPTTQGPDHHRLTSTEYAKATTDSIAQMRAPGRKILLIEPIPLPRKPDPFFNPYQCLEQAKTEEECRYTPFLKTSGIELVYRKLAADNDDVYDLDLDRMVCPLLPICDPVVEGSIVKRDPSHLKVLFALKLVPQVEMYLQSYGLEDTPQR